MAGVHTLPVDIEQVVYAGCDLIREYRWFPDGVNPQDFTGWHARMLVGPLRGAATVTLTDGAGLGLSADGIITIHLTGTQTDTLTGTNLVYALDLTDTTGVVLRFLHGRFTVVREVTP